LKNFLTRLEGSGSGRGCRSASPHFAPLVALGLTRRSLEEEVGNELVE